MRIKVPMTGTVADFSPASHALDGIGISGDLADPVRPVNLPNDLPGVGWHLVSVDLDNDLMEIEVEASPDVVEPAFDGQGKALKDNDGNQVNVRRPATDTEKQAALDTVQHYIDSHTTEEHYQLSGDKHLVKPVHVMLKYRQAVLVKEADDGE